MKSAIVLLLSAALCGSLGAACARASATFSVPQEDLPDPLVLIAYGDMRFTAPSEIRATNPARGRR